jgi:hypothetical protein
MAKEDSELSIEVLNASRASESAPNAGYDNYRSLVDPNIMIFVGNDAVPPFRFKAGGWELSQSAIDLGPAMKARIAEQGFFMCRVNEDQSGWTELADLVTADAKENNDVAT